MLIRSHIAFWDVALILGGVFLTLCHSQAFAGTEASAEAEITRQQTQTDNAFPLHFSISTGAESEFVFRGVNILPEVDINPTKVATEAIHLRPSSASASAANLLKLFPGKSIQQIVETAPALKRYDTPLDISHGSGIDYVEGTISASSVTLGAFYASQIESRVEDDNKYLIAKPGASLGHRPLFDEFREIDGFLQYAHPIGPLSASAGATVYHVVNNTNFDTAELNLGISYTPPQFPYVEASFSYDYDSAFDFSDFNGVVNKSTGATIHGEYLDGHYLEARLVGNIPIYKHVVTFTPYLLVSAGSGIVPRAFNSSTLPTYINTQREAKAEVSTNTVASAFDPASLDRPFDLSNFQTGFRVPIYLTHFISLRGDFNYSRPLGNLISAPYYQKDQIWGGASLTVSF